MISALRPIDCDMHPVVPNIRALVPYLPANWAASVDDRGIEGFDSISYPPNAPLSARPDWRPGGKGLPVSLDDYRRHVLDRLDVQWAIGNCLYGAHLAFSEDLGVALASAVNDWMVDTWLDPEPRMRASIVVAPQNPQRAAEEIDRCAPDRRFVQVLLPAMVEAPLGQRRYWPIYEAAQKHGLPVGIHAGSSYRHAVTPVGWPTYFVEDYASQALAFQGQLGSLISEGVFNKFPALTVVLLESGVTWLTPFLWRLTKFWRGTRSEVPWVTKPPIDIAREHIRLSAQPFDAPDDAATVARILEHLPGKDMLLFASDYPHHQFDGDAVLPQGLDQETIRRMAQDNPRATYRRLEEAL
ncbi:amidohydrolase [Devosia sp. PTR5]|uniref:Amidohydrolase n=1 Tax=Devosia oryzisoli TaxID=2774138 RepID=A0A927FW60_9HYPH|nr:amidohydrolase family protein [Devosia oryzisoli]MBD8065136.1 amidohydrolase [Devosia oryzisoli]